MVEFRRTRQSSKGIVAAMALSVLAATLVAQTPLKDVPGSKDPAGVKRYEGSSIIGYKFEKFGEYAFLLGPIATTTGKPVPTKVQRAQGQRTRLVYVAPEGRSTLEVLRNYQQELTRSGFTVAYRCAAADCGVSELADTYLYTIESRLSNYPAPGSGGPPGQVTEYAFSSAKDQRLLVAKRTGAPGEAWASVYVATATFGVFKETLNHPIVLLDFVEAAGMEAKMVTVDAAAMAKDIASAGHVALYGILFDTDKADLKPESASTIAEIAKYLKANPTVKLHVVGHTDNVGVHDYNMGLSSRRAAAVVAELTTKHAIPAARLRPAGVGPLAPVAPNDTDDGRAKNRRVELVRQ
jgi:outer membrane protein OmpA-like peptidoglycan-associated protein